MWEHDWGRWCGGVGVADNQLGAEGGRAVVEGLKHNSTLTGLNLAGEFAPSPSICGASWWGLWVWCVAGVGGGCGWWFVGGVGTNV